MASTYIRVSVQHSKVKCTWFRITCYKPSVWETHLDLTSESHIFLDNDGPHQCLTRKGNVEAQSSCGVCSGFSLPYFDCNHVTQKPDVQIDVLLLMCDVKTYLNFHSLYHCVQNTSLSPAEKLKV